MFSNFHFANMLCLCMKIRENDSVHEFIPTKFAAVRLFHQYKIKWIIWSARELYYLSL